MKRLFAILVAILALTSVAFAQAPALPDYVKDGNLLGTWACDDNKTIMKVYGYKDLAIIETRPASGGVFVGMLSQTGFNYFMQATGSTEMKVVSEKEFSEALAQNSPNSYKEYREIQNDCRR